MYLEQCLASTEPEINVSYFCVFIIKMAFCCLSLGPLTSIMLLQITASLCSVWVPVAPVALECKCTLEKPEAVLRTGCWALLPGLMHIQWLCGIYWGDAFIHRYLLMAHAHAVCGRCLGHSTGMNKGDRTPCSLVGCEMAYSGCFFSSFTNLHFLFFSVTMAFWSIFFEEFLKYCHETTSWMWSLITWPNQENKIWQ